MQASDEISGIYYVKTGFIQQFINTQDGEHITLHVFRPQSFFPIMLVLSDAPNKYDFRALTDAQVYKAPREEVMDFIRKEPDVLYDLAIRLSEGINGLLERFEHEKFRGAEHKVASLLLYLAQKYGEKKSDSSVTITIPLTHTDIASWVGTQRETVSRQIEKLEKSGILAREQKSIIVHDLKKLQKLLEEG